MTTSADRVALTEALGSVSRSLRRQRRRAWITAVLSVMALVGPPLMVPDYINGLGLGLLLCLVVATWGRLAMPSQEVRHAVATAIERVHQARPGSIAAPFAVVDSSLERLRAASWLERGLAARSLHHEEVVMLADGHSLAGSWGVNGPPLGATGVAVGDLGTGRVALVCGSRVLWPHGRPVEVRQPGGATSGGRSTPA